MIRNHDDMQTIFLRVWAAPKSSFSAKYVKFRTINFRERERRLKDLARQSDEHHQAVEDLRREYMATLDKVKEIKTYQLDSTRDAAQVTR